MIAPVDEAEAKLLDNAQLSVADDETRQQRRIDFLDIWKHTNYDVCQYYYGYVTLTYIGTFYSTGGWAMFQAWSTVNTITKHKRLANKNDFSADRKRQKIEVLHATCANI